ncbi:unnamed protein product [Mytilus coruscus]|uniref:C2H2-type domain-containing protein n=1 Tax=Mytilus coruscus TaxID=42192 RepID=A0A6J8E244_MYTCO|nr:unnamed protein product [Mytilus coruscus]
MAQKYECQQCGASFSKIGMVINHRRQFGHKDIYPCTICQKTFGRKDNLDRHILRHQDMSLFQCNDCGKLFSRHDNLHRHREENHNQIGRDNTLEIEKTHVELPTGGTKKPSNNTDQVRFLKTKQCILSIKNKDEICCARAFVTAKANIDKHEKWHGIRQGRKLQEHLAIELHTLANVPLHICGIEEINKFQAVMPVYQIHVISKEHFNGVIFQGPKAEKTMYLYFHDEHFDVITSMPPFLSRSYYCHTCKKGYQHKEEHRCNNICTSCHKIHNKRDTATTITVILMVKHFNGEECYRLHAQTTRKCHSTCKSY